MADDGHRSLDEIRARVAEVKWWHDWDIVPGVRTNGTSSMERARYFKIPEDLTGKRVLDIGCSDGYFSFLAESRGAEVVSIDSWPRRGFPVAHDILGSKAEFHHASVYDVTPERFGYFDIVFLFGVYYHLKNPLLALERIAAVTREWALVESEILPVPPERRLGQDAAWQLLGLEQERALAEFIDNDQLLNDPTNWWIPNVSCLLHTVRAAGFPRAEVVTCYDQSRCIVKAFKGPRTATRPLTEDIIIAIDQPAKESRITGRTQIEGWALSQLYPTDGITGVWAYLDRMDDPACELGAVETGLPHAGLPLFYSNHYPAPAFRLQWDTSGIKPGYHTLHILADGRLGWNYRSSRIYIASPGEMVGAAAAPEVLPRGLPVLEDESLDLEPLIDIMQRDYQVRSRVPVLGPLIAWVRRNATSHLREPYLDPTLNRQVAWNRRMTTWLKRVMDQILASGRRQAELEARVEALEARLAQVTRGEDEQT